MGNPNPVVLLFRPTPPPKAWLDSHVDRFASEQPPAAVFAGPAEAIEARPFHGANLVVVVVRELLRTPSKSRETKKKKNTGQDRTGQDITRQTL